MSVMSSDYREIDGIPTLRISLGWDNYMAFKKELIAFAQTKNGHVVNTIKTMVDVPPQLIQASVLLQTCWPRTKTTRLPSEIYAQKELQSVRRCTEASKWT